MVCRHGVQLAALNMFQGEIFAYPMYLQYTYAHMHKLFLCQDVICKYYPYLQSIVAQLPDDPKMQAIGEHKHFLSLMHGTTHEWRCQVIFFPLTGHPNNICYYFKLCTYYSYANYFQVEYGGRYQQGSGNTTGEEAEQVNSYMSRTGRTTKIMTKAGRNELITSHAAHWNRRKIDSLPCTLPRRYLRVRIKNIHLNLLQVTIKYSFKSEK